MYLVKECVKMLQSCPTLCNPMDCSPPGFSVHGILQARILEWVAVSFSGALSDPGMEPTFLKSCALVGTAFFTTASSGKPEAFRGDNNV